MKPRQHIFVWLERLRDAYQKRAETSISLNVPDVYYKVIDDLNEMLALECREVPKEKDGGPG